MYQNVRSGACTVAVLLAPYLSSSKLDGLIKLTYLVDTASMPRRRGCRRPCRQGQYYWPSALRAATVLHHEHIHRTGIRPGSITGKGGRRWGKIKDKRACPVSYQSNRTSNSTSSPTIVPEPQTKRAAMDIIIQILKVMTMMIFKQSHPNQCLYYKYASYGNYKPGHKNTP
jgi:hypothetical protein